MCIETTALDCYIIIACLNTNLSILGSKVLALRAFRYPMKSSEICCLNLSEDPRPKN